MSTTQTDRAAGAGHPSGSSGADGLPSRSAAPLLVGAVVAGAVLAAFWPWRFVDETVAGTVMDAAFRDGSEVTLTGLLIGSAFAFVTGIAGTFTACNVAAFGAIGPMLERGESATGRLRAVAGPLGWMAVGMVAVSSVYGAVGVVLGERLPQLSPDATATGMPLLLVQSSVVFSVLGVVLAYLGLATAGVVPDVLRTLRQRWAPAPLVLMGAIIGGFLVGRPFGLFMDLFAHAAEQGNPLYGALVFVLQSIGNVVVLGLLFALVAVAAGQRVASWLSSASGSRVAGAVLLWLGTFTLLYWGGRVPAFFDYGWFPTGF